MNKDLIGKLAQKWTETWRSSLVTNVQTSTRAIFNTSWINCNTLSKLGKQDAMHYNKQFMQVFTIVT